MKKSVLAIALAVLMTVSLLTVGALADGTVYEVSTQEGLNNALSEALDGDVVRLVGDIVLEPKESKVEDSIDPLFYIYSDVTIDLNGHAIRWSEDVYDKNIPYILCIFSIVGSNVTIIGDGLVDVEAGYNNSYGMNIINNGSLTIDSNATFTAAMTAIQVQQGALNIYGGTFKLAKTIAEDAPQYAKYIINAIDANYKTGSADVAITGGTFIGFDPSNSPEGDGTSYVVGECDVTGTGEFVISAPTTQSDNSVAEVNGMYFTNLSNAIAAANRGATVKLLKDFTEEDVVIPKLSDITLDLNGKTFNAGEKLISQGNLTIIDSTAMSEPMVSADYETVTYNSGKIEVSVAAYAAFGGTVTLKSGSIVSTYLGAYVQGDTTGATTIPSTFNIEGGYIEAKEFAATTQGNGATLNISGGVLVAKDNAVVAGNGTVSGGKDMGGTAINISGGTMIGRITSPGYIACGVYHPQQGALNISGGTIYADGGVGILMRAGDANITGGDIIATGNASGKVGDSTIIQNCYGIVYDETSSYPGMTASDIVTISGNASVTADAGSEAICVMQNETAGAERVAVKGGSYSSSVADYVDDTLNFEVNNFGTYAYYTDFETALANALPGAQIINLNAEPSAAMYSLVVDPANNGQVIRVSVSAGTEYTLPDAPKNSGYIFLGWRNGNATYKAGDAVTVNSDMTFTAIWGNLPDVDPEEPEEPEVSDFPFYDVNIRDWYYDAVYYVWDKGLMDGVDTHEFAPNATLTRAMVWTIIARAEGVDTTGGNSWYAKAQEWVVAKGISDGENPSAAITRQELVTMLYRLAGEPTVSGTITAPDAESVSSWASDAMVWAMNIGLIEGDENGAVTPTATATRAQAAAIFMRYIEA